MGGMYYFEGYEEMFNYPEYVMGSNYNLLIYLKAIQRSKALTIRRSMENGSGFCAGDKQDLRTVAEALSFNNLTASWWGI